jgi:hypothetical protein
VKQDARFQKDKALLSVPLKLKAEAVGEANKTVWRGILERLVPCFRRNFWIVETRGHADANLRHASLTLVRKLVAQASQFPVVAMWRCSSDC